MRFAGPDRGLVELDDGVDAGLTCPVWLLTLDAARSWRLLRPPATTALALGAGHAVVAAGAAGTFVSGDDGAAWRAVDRHPATDVAVDGTDRWVTTSTQLLHGGIGTARLTTVTRLERGDRLLARSGRAYLWTGGDKPDTGRLRLREITPAGTVHAVPLPCDASRPALGLGSGDGLAIYCGDDPIGGGEQHAVIWASADAGRTWHRRRMVFSGYVSSIAAAGTTIFYAGGRTPVERLVAGADPVDAAPGIDELANDDGTSVAFSTARDGTAWDLNGRGVAVTADGGHHWTYRALDPPR